jgi:hypothetical protein
MSKAELPIGEGNPGKAEWSEVFSQDKALREAVNSITNEQIAPGAAIAGSKLAEKTIEAKRLSDDAKNLFPQLATAAVRKINFGTGTVNFSGGSHLSDEPEITHGLGVAPKAVLLTATHSAVNMACEVLVGTTKFKPRGVWCWDDFYAEGNYTFYWVAIG